MTSSHGAPNASGGPVGEQPTATNPLGLIDAMHIRCGAATPEPLVAVLQELQTLAHDALTGENHQAGCGKKLLWWDSYRCVDCDKFFHLECIREHFERTKTT
jgi:hypothetical protein